MSQYQVNGTIAGEEVSSVVIANDGADAIRQCVLEYLVKNDLHFNGRDWHVKRRAWVSENVRLNATQVA